MQEKKVKKFSETNIDTSENGIIASASTTATRFISDGAYAERPHSHLSNDFSIPPGGSSLLRLPVVLLLILLNVQNMICNLDPLKYTKGVRTLNKSTWHL